MSTILLTGGTGTLGRLVLARLRGKDVNLVPPGEREGGGAPSQGGIQVRVLSRHPHEPVDGIEYVTGDLSTGEGLEVAVADVATIVHCAGSSKGDEDKTRQLVRAAARAGHPHLVNISVVGADRIPVVSRVDRTTLGYFAMKLATERVVEESGLPWTTLRAAQFHDLVLTFAQAMAKLPVIPVPAGWRFQPIEADEVAARMVELAMGEPAGLVPEIAGPRVYQLGDLLRSYLAATRKRRLLVPVPLPGRANRAVREGANLAPDHRAGRTWEEFLAERLATGQGG